MRLKCKIIECKDINNKSFRTFSVAWEEGISTKYIDNNWLEIERILGNLYQYRLEQIIYVDL